MTSTSLEDLLDMLENSKPAKCENDLEQISVAKRLEGITQQMNNAIDLIQQLHEKVHLLGARTSEPTAVPAEPQERAVDPVEKPMAAAIDQEVTDESIQQVHQDDMPASVCSDDAIQSDTENASTCQTDGVIREGVDEVHATPPQTPKVLRHRCRPPLCGIPADDMHELVLEVADPMEDALSGQCTPVKANDTHSPTSVEWAAPRDPNIEHTQPTDTQADAPQESFVARMREEADQVEEIE
jgi:hypothetical protein